MPRGEGKRTLKGSFVKLCKEINFINWAVNKCSIFCVFLHLYQEFSFAPTSLLRHSKIDVRLKSDSLLWMSHLGC